MLWCGVLNITLFNDFEFCAQKRKRNDTLIQSWHAIFHATIVYVHLYVIFIFLCLNSRHTAHDCVCVYVCVCLLMEESETDFVFVCSIEWKVSILYIYLGV